MYKQSMLFLFLISGLGSSALAQTSFDHDRFAAPPVAGPGILSEGYPGPPVVSITDVAMGLVPADEIDALSFGDDHLIGVLPHTLVFSVDSASMGIAGCGVSFEASIDTGPGAPPAAAGDIFIQDPSATYGNLLAPPFLGYGAGTATGDEANATWGAPCMPAACYDLDAFDYSVATSTTNGVYFSLAPGSPTLGMLGVGPGAILYSDLSGVPPVIAVLAGAGLATAPNLGIPGLNLDALNCVGTSGPVGTGGGVISAGLVGMSSTGPAPPPSTHLLEFSVAFSGAIDADVLVRVGAGAFAIHTPSAVLGLMPFDNLNALEVTQPLDPDCPPLGATVSHYNGAGINLDTLLASNAVIGGVWTATLTPQLTRMGGGWIVLMRTASAAGPIFDLGLALGLPAAGLSELLVGGAVIGTFFGPPHAGGGSSTTFSLAVPLNCALIGKRWYAQSIVLGDLPIGPGTLDPWFSSASKGVIGTY
ncbi:MAG: hypothetical protein CMJ89_12145 [Planctomycetes bacterium]|nr:hypothetical protein [Planctomycetota bacterium]